MISNELKNAREYEGKNIPLVPMAQRPKFHVTGGIGWINDPNGFSLYKGEYHLFYQYHPFSTNWGPMHWGHVKTKDFIKWDRLPIALAPDKSYDRFGCFSGSGLELSDGKHLLIYTSVFEEKNGNDKIETYQQQSIAVGDGTNYDKFESNPVIRTSQIPKGNSLFDFRDPKIYEKDGIFYVIVGSLGADNIGEIVRYKSKDLKDFEFDSVIYKSNGQYGKMWECPDYFELDGKNVLMASPQEMANDGLEFPKGNGTIFVIGKEENGVLIKENLHTCDYGIDFYAPQTLLSKDGRRIMIAWMQAWETSGYAHEGKQIYGAMTLPRELTLKNNKIYSWPVHEFDKYHKDKISADNIVISKDPVQIDGVSGRVFDMFINLKSDFESFKINLACNDSHQTSIIVQKDKNTITLDRHCCGIDDNVISEKSFRIAEFEELSLRIIMDENSIELFVNGGEKTATMLTYTELEAEGISFEAKSKAIANIDFYTLNI